MLNVDDFKTELMLMNPNRTRHLHNLPTSITFGNAQIPAKNLGFILDCHFAIIEHVSTIAWTCLFEVHHLASICRFLRNNAMATLVSAFALSRIDYCSSPLLGYSDDVTTNMLLHWLLVKVRSTSK